MKIEIDRPRCEGHARCNAIVPELFVLDEDGYIDTDGFDVPPALEDDAEVAAASCPERVITVVR
ncbi:ferredoxin [Streptomyces mexicanus]|jgi:ferredoxin|uniref:Ferredoxin n=1 Tax=Streptomyces mexicanus TaxID=178566 RepID=A0A7X1HXN8_9ACTN|nr:ferredoxin [Streptomyces mexicanus]MBC2864947.1 ferredoxin [Streptomyces mexicanus]